MNGDRPATPRDESGAALILAIAFLVVVGAIAVALVSSITSGVNDRAILDEVRNRQYGADAAIEYRIADLRQADASTIGFQCEDEAYSVAGVSYRVDCANAPGVTLGGFLQRNVIFTACEGDLATPKCTDATQIIRAQVNFQTAGSPLTVQRTWVQAWSVNG